MRTLPQVSSGWPLGATLVVWGRPAGPDALAGNLAPAKWPAGLLRRRRERVAYRKSYEAMLSDALAGILGPL